MSAALKLPKTNMTDAEWQTRCELAALYHVVNHHRLDRSDQHPHVGAHPG